MPSPVQLVVFDLDGTLIDSKLDLAHAVNATRAHLSLPAINHELIFSYVGNGAPVLIRKALPEADESMLQPALEFFLAYYSEHRIDFTTLYPRVRETISVLSAAGLKLAILTNKPIRLTNLILRDLEVASFFFQVYGGNSFAQKKPDPVGILQLLSDANVSAEGTVMVGDSSVDILTARNAGIRSVGCTWGFQPESLVAHPPDWLIGGMDELPSVLQIAQP